MSLSAKLIAAFGLSVTVTIILAAAAIWGSNSMEGAIARFDRSEQELRTLERLATKLQKRHAALSRYVYAGHDDARREAAWAGAEARGLVTSLINSISGRVESPGDDRSQRQAESDQLSRLVAFRNRLDEVDAAWWACVAEAGPSLSEQARSLFDESCDKPLKNDLLPRIDGMIQAERVSVELHRAYVTSLSGGVRVGAWVASIGAIVVAGVAVILLRRSVEAVNQLREAEAAANETKTMFLANMSHEIRTPLNGILGFTQLLARQQGDVSDPETQSFVATIQSCGNHLLELINDILDLSKVEAGKVDCDLESCPVLPIFDEVLSALRPRASAKSISLVFRWVGPLPAFIRTDRSRLKQILLNLVGNAVKFTEAGGVSVEARVERRGVDWCMTTDITDTGIGIAPDQLHAIFQPFRQADSSLTREYEGTGLGLSISHRLAAMLGGEIAVESTPGEGTVFQLVVNVGPLDGVEMCEMLSEECFAESSPTNNMADRLQTTLR